MSILSVKKFPQLTTDELYMILQLRSEVFVVEQDCVYLDIDGIDKRATHVFSIEDGRCAGCLRIFYRDAETVQIGRVVTSSSKRGTGLGRQLMEEALRVIDAGMPCRSVYLEAQTYAIGFYARFGFQVASDEFLEDGIPHVQMLAHRQA